MIKLELMDCRSFLPVLEENSVDSCVCDPPYAINFLNRDWDKILPSAEIWNGILRVLRPGGYLLSFGGTKTYHRLACVIEDVGFELVDCIMWVNGQGYPKGKSCLKPGYEPILMARKPGKAITLNVEECRIGTHKNVPASTSKTKGNCLSGSIDGSLRNETGNEPGHNPNLGRYPSNFIHDGSEEVLNLFAQFGEKNGGHYPSHRGASGYEGGLKGQDNLEERHVEKGTAARFFYCAKASKKERGENNNHVTVKPISLMEHLVKLVTPVNGLCLDPFVGSGTTALACLASNRSFVGCEINPEYHAIACKRITNAKH